MDKCEDCHATTFCTTVAACSDSHWMGSNCCIKQVCAYGCKKTCQKCGKENVVDVTEADAGYYTGFICYDCHSFNRVYNIAYYGSFIEMCKRMCTNCYAQKYTPEELIYRLALQGKQHCM